MLSIPRESSIPELVQELSKHMLTNSEAACSSDSIQVGANVTHYTEIIVSSDDEDVTGALFVEALGSVLAQLCSDKFAKRVSKASAKNSIVVRCDSKTNSAQVALRTVISWHYRAPKLDTSSGKEVEGGDKS